MPSYATTYARDSQTGQTLFDSVGNPIPLLSGGQSSSYPLISAVDFYRDSATGQILFDVNGYPLVETGDFYNDDGVLAFQSIADAAGGWPTSAAGLPAGAVWCNELTVSVVPGVTPSPTAPAVYFGQISPTGLLTLGGGNLPLMPGDVGSLQLWNNGWVVAIS